MRCPIDTTVDLVMTDRQGVEIDYCPQCRGVWLDRGELDKIIERNADSAPVSASPPLQPQGQQASWGHQPQGHFGHHKPHKKRRSFLEDLFD